MLKKPLHFNQFHIAKIEGSNMDYKNKKPVEFKRIF
jgi:hypothetical protein